MRCVNVVVFSKGSLIHNRYITSYIFWRNDDVRGKKSWTGQRQVESPSHGSKVNRRGGYSEVRNLRSIREIKGTYEDSACNISPHIAHVYSSRSMHKRRGMTVLYIPLSSFFLVLYFFFYINPARLLSIHRYAHSYDDAWRCPCQRDWVITLSFTRWHIFLISTGPTNNMHKSSLRYNDLP